jgi:hypothetical protein
MYFFHTDKRRVWGIEMREHLGRCRHWNSKQLGHAELMSG